MTTLYCPFRHSLEVMKRGEGVAATDCSSPYALFLMFALLVYSDMSCLCCLFLWCILLTLLVSCEIAGLPPCLLACLLWYTWSIVLVSCAISYLTCFAYFLWYILSTFLLPCHISCIHCYICLGCFIFPHSSRWCYSLVPKVLRAESDLPSPVG